MGDTGTLLHSISCAPRPALKMKAAHLEDTRKNQSQIGISQRVQIMVYIQRYTILTARERCSRSLSTEHQRQSSCLPSSHAQVATTTGNTQGRPWYDWVLSHICDWKDTVMGALPLVANRKSRLNYVILTSLWTFLQNCIWPRGWQHWQA